MAVAVELWGRANSCCILFQALAEAGAAKWAGQAERRESRTIFVVAAVLRAAGESAGQHEKQAIKHLLLRIMTLTLTLTSRNAHWQISVVEIRFHAEGVNMQLWTAFPLACS